MLMSILLCAWTDHTEDKLLEQSSIVNVAMYNLHANVVWRIVMSRLRGHHNPISKEVLSRFRGSSRHLHICS